MMLFCFTDLKSSIVIKGLLPSHLFKKPSKKSHFMFKTMGNSNSVPPNKENETTQNNELVLRFDATKNCSISDRFNLMNKLNLDPLQQEQIVDFCSGRLPDSRRIIPYEFAQLAGIREEMNYIETVDLKDIITTNSDFKIKILQKKNKFIYDKENKITNW
eukprot:NODE_153_length_16933_cov_0.442141.p10 type:complete len:160 gc:universal NODE_153_length_16933_cov_0.442141:9767-9288(-)